MRVYLFETKETKEVNDSYGARLIEQGKAKTVPARVKKETKAAETESK